MSWTWSQATTPLTGNSDVDAIINSNVITYNYKLPFKNYINFSFDPSQASTAAAGASALTYQQQLYVRQALSYVNQVTGINFNELPAGSADTQELVFVYSTNTGFGANGQANPDYVFTEYPTFTTGSGFTINSLTIKNTIALSTHTSTGIEAMLQGIGQALGLKIAAAGTLSSGKDIDTQTLMSSNLSGQSPSTFSTLDVMALNWLYGGDGLLGQWGLCLNANNVPVPNGGPPGGVIVGGPPAPGSQIFGQSS